MENNNNNEIKVLRLSDINHNEYGLCQFDFHGCFYFTKGEGELVLDFEAYRFKKGTWLSFEQHQLLSTKFDNDVDGFVILFTENFIDTEMLKSFRKHLNLILTDKNTSEENIYGFILNLYKEYKNKNSRQNEALLKRQFETILLKVDRCAPSRKIPYTKLYFNSFLVFKHIVFFRHRKTRNAMDYADDLDITYKHLNTICKTVSGKTAKDFINDYLVLSIKRELLLNDKPIKTLTSEFGFDEPTNFVKYFKRYTGKTPKVFRQTFN